MSKRILKINARCNELEVIYKGCLNPRPLEDTLVFGKMPPLFLLSVNWKVDTPWI